LKNKRSLNRFIGASWAVLCVLLLLGLGWAMNVLLLPEETVPGETTLPATEPTDPPTDPTVPALSIPEITLTARHSFVYILETGQFLMLKGEEDDKIYPASLTKLFSTYVALLYMDPEEVIKVGNEVNTVSADSSVAGLRVGDKLTVKQLVEAMLLPSGNDAAVVLAVATGRKLENDPQMSYTTAKNRFVEEMNFLARTFSLTGTHFVNPDGYHNENHYTTCRDMQKIGQMALTNKTIRQAMATQKVVVDLQYDYPGGWKNTNLLIQPGSEYYNNAAIGMKTGYTRAAGYCLMSAFRMEGKTLMVGIFGCPESNDRFIDANGVYNAYMKGVAEADGCFLQ
jgi:D-alanyl-D-alanine carboxypeptidase (penicillin-binding protein 5/6)